MRRKENKWWGPVIFFLGPPKYFLLKMGRKMCGDAFSLYLQNFTP